MAVVVVGYAAGPWVLDRYLTGLPSLGVIAASLGLSALAYVPVAVIQVPSQVPSGRVLASIVPGSPSSARRSRSSSSSS